MCVCGVKYEQQNPMKIVLFKIYGNNYKKL